MISVNIFLFFICLNTYCFSNPILQIGDTNLRLASETVSIYRMNSDFIRTVLREVHSTLLDFRATHGFGRAMAAPQIGYHIRMIAVCLPGEDVPLSMFNPVPYFSYAR